MSIRKVKMATAILILLNADKHGHSSDMLKKPYLHSQKLRTVVGTLASHGLEEPAHASRGLEEPFFQLCCCVSFWFWREIGFG